MALRKLLVCNPLNMHHFPSCLRTPAVDTAVMPQDKQYIKQILENLNISEKIAHENDQHFQNRNKQ